MIILYIVVGLVILFFGGIYLYSFYLDSQKRKHFDMLFPVDYKTKETFKYLGKKYDKDKYLQYRVDKLYGKLERYSMSGKILEARKVGNNEFHAEICYEMDKEARDILIKRLKNEIKNKTQAVEDEIKELIMEGDKQIDEDIFHAAANYYEAYFFLESKVAEEKLKVIIDSIDFLVAFEKFRISEFKMRKEQGFHFDYPEQFQKYVSYVYEYLFNKDNFINKDEKYIEICVAENIKKILINANEFDYKDKIKEYFEKNMMFEGMFDKLDIAKCNTKEETCSKINEKLEKIIEEINI